MGRGDEPVMQIQGEGAFAGVVQGRLHCYHRVGAATVKNAGADPEQEKIRLDEACSKAKEQLRALTERCLREVGVEAAEVFASHAMLLEDEDYLSCIEEVLLRERCCAEYAVQQAGTMFASVFETIDDPYMRERGGDILDVTWRLLRSLAGAGAGGAATEGPVILAADDLNPTEFIELDRERVLAIVIRRDSRHSHAVILARQMGIPTICNLGDCLQPEYHGHMARVDGTTGIVTIF